MIPHQVLQARRTLSRLKRGVPPANDVAQIAIGLESLQSTLGELLQPSAATRWFAVQGEYGEGKSFFEALAQEQALAAGYAVACLEVNKDDGALHQPQRHLSLVLKSLRSPQPLFAQRIGFAEIMRHWLEEVPRPDAIRILEEAQSIAPWSPAGLDPDRLAQLVRYLAVGHSPIRSLTDAGPAEIVWDSDGNAYLQGAITRAVHWRPSGSENWEYFAPPEKWPGIRRLLSSISPPIDQRPTFHSSHASSFPEFLAFMSAEDIARKSGYHRFAAAYRLQVIIEWLRATGHTGLFFFIDEVDNVTQIHGKAHPACFRSLAWYCSCPTLQHLRVVFAGTPEIFDTLENGALTAFAESLRTQETVRHEEVRVYNRWKREVEEKALGERQTCVALRPSQRVDLFDRIAAIHRLAWGETTQIASIDIRQLARRSEFNTTRRWVRASVQLLDLLHQQQHPDPSNLTLDVPLHRHEQDPATLTAPTTIVIDDSPCSPPVKVDVASSKVPLPSSSPDSPIIPMPTCPAQQSESMVAEPVPTSPAPLESQRFEPGDDGREVIRVIGSSTEPVGVWLLHVKTKIPIPRLLRILPELVDHGVAVQTGSGTTARYSRQRGY